MSNEPKRAEMGQQAINLLGSSKLATPEDGALLKIGTEDPLEAAYYAQLAEGADNVAISDDVEARLERVDDSETRRDNEGDNNDDTGR